MGLLEKAKSYREKLIIESLSGQGDLFERKQVTLEDLKILKDYYERTLSEKSLPVGTKFSLLSLVVKVAEDVKYFSSIESIASTLYTVLSRVGFNVTGIGYFYEKFDVVYGTIDENEVPSWFGSGYYVSSNGSTYFRVPGEMATFIVAKCSGSDSISEDVDMVISRCFDILSVALKLIQNKSGDVYRFYGYRNALIFKTIRSILEDIYIEPKDKVVMLAYYFKEFFGLNYVIVFSDKMVPEVAFGLPFDAIRELKLDENLIGRNINVSQVVDMNLSLLFGYGSKNIAFIKFMGRVIGMGSTYDLSSVIEIIGSIA
jgi:hypothetical protein